MENAPAARDSLALLAVMLEQGALDQGRLDLGQILTLTDDPPAAIFTNKQVSQLSKSRAFSPLADQRWVTTALAYIKELDTISTKRIEMMAGASSSSQLGGGSETQLGPGRGSPKQKGRGKGRNNQAAAGAAAEEA